MLKKHLFITILALITIFKYASAVTCNSSFPYSYSGACFQQCPWNNTVVTYLQNSGTACLLSNHYYIQIVQVAHLLMTQLKLALRVLII